MSKAFNITILGGTAGFGKWLAEFIIRNFNPQEVQLTITGNDLKKGQQIAQNLDCSFSTNNISSVKEADITVVAVPIQLTNQVIQEIAPHLKKDSILTDVTSVKNQPSLQMKKYAPTGVLVIPAHPLFGPFVKNIIGQAFILTPDEEVKTNKKYLWLKNFLLTRGAKVIEKSPTEHDHLMTVVQGVTHYTLFVMGETLRKLEADLELSDYIASPVYKMMNSMIGRYINQNHGLYADIQMNNNENLKMHQLFIETAQEFNQIVQKKERAEFINKTDLIEDFFGEEANKGQKYSDKLIYLYAQQLKKLQKSIGQSITLENIYSKEQLK